MNGRLAIGRVPRSVLLAVALVLLAVIVVFTINVTASGQPGHQGPPPTAKPFSLPELGRPGRSVSLAAFAGQPVILNFFASWCPPCKRETPLLARFYAEHGGRIPVIGIDNNDPIAAALRFARDQRVGYPVGVDQFPARTALSYGVLNLPETFFLNARHRIVAHIFGDVTASELSAWAAQVDQAGKAARL